MPAALRSPRAVFGLFVLFHVVLWTLLPYLTGNNQPLDVIEGYAWGREALIGTAKHPPMQAWVLEIMARLTGRADWASYLACQLCIATTLWSVYRLGRLIASEGAALSGALFLEGSAYLTLTGTEFNPNLLLPAFWSLAALAFYRALTNGRSRDWALTGLWLAGGLYSKYATGLLIGLFTFVLLARPEGRKALRTSGPWLMASTTALLFLPHLIWLTEHAFLPFAYAHSRTEAATHLVDHLLFPLRFAGAQALAGCGIGLLFWAAPKRAGEPSISPLARFYLTALCFGPCSVILLASFVGGIKLHDMWGAALWNWLGLWLAAIGGRWDQPPFTPRFRQAFMLVALLLASIFILENLVVPHGREVPKRVHFPGRQLAREIDKRWREATGTDLAYVIGDVWLAGNVAFYAPEEPRPHVDIDGNPAISPWIDAHDLRQRGGVLVWWNDRGHDAAAVNAIPWHLAEHFPTAKLQKEIEITNNNFSQTSPLHVGWAIVAP
jgi:4-amino-4-deoxy-L-arabinose transferase-like glycosyltransferase